MQIASSKKIFFCSFKAKTAELKIKKKLIWYDKSNWHVGQI